MLSRAAQHDDPHLRVLAVLLEGVAERIEHRAVVAVGAIRPVEADCRDATARD
jgi:hypothetical protein